MKLQLTKTKTIDISFGGKKRSASSDLTGVELFGSDERGVPAVRIARRKGVWQLLAADFLKPPTGELPEKWEDVSHRSTWEVPSAFQSPHAALAVNSRLSIFAQTSSDAILQDMSHGIPTVSATANDPGIKRFALRRGAAVPARIPTPTPAPTGAAPARLPMSGIPTATNGMRFTIRPMAEEGLFLETALPEFQVLWLSRLLPEGHRPTASSIQVAEAALMASLLAQPSFTEAGGNMLAMFMLADVVFFAGYKAGCPVLWRRCPVRGGYMAMRETVKRGLKLDDGMVASVLEDTLIDPRGALEPFLGPILNELELSRAYLVGKHGMKIDRILLSGLPFGGQHVRALARDTHRLEIFEPGVFDGFQQPPKGAIAGDCAYLTALGAALAASEVTT